MYAVFICDINLTLIVLFCFIVILNWLVGKEWTDAALKGRLIEEEEVECIPENVSNSIVDENVDINIVNKYFTSDAWLLVQQVQQLKRHNTASWTCHSCSGILEDEQLRSVCCEACLNWYHFKCAGLVRKPKMKNWFCRQCYADVS